MELARGLYIAFEAVDGVGKTTQIKLLKQWLEHEHYPVFITREPGGTDCAIAEKIRNLILDPYNNTMLPQTEALLFAASRTQSINEIIVPHLENKEIVLTDRSIGSSLAYQGYGRELNVNTIKRINDFGMENYYPDFTFYLQIPYEEAMKRRIARACGIDRMEASDKEFFTRSIEGFDAIARKNSTWITIDATGDIDKTQTTIRMLMRSIFSMDKWRVKKTATQKRAEARTNKDYVHGTEGSYREENIYDD